MARTSKTDTLVNLCSLDKTEQDEILKEILTVKHITMTVLFYDGQTLVNTFPLNQDKVYVSVYSEITLGN